jgi:tetratricopeptide (TPR) repeat protein
VSLPDLSRTDPNVQAQVRKRYAELTNTLARTGATDAERGMAYGRMAVLLHAAEYYEAATPMYLNAQALMPDEPRWPYYLAHLYKSQGDTAKSMASFMRVLELKPNDVATLVWLGRAYLDQGQAEKAEPLFLRAQTEAPQTVAVLVGLGRTALARRDFARAAMLLEDALSLDPSAASIHSPLAMAYRGLGDTPRAEAHLKQWRNTEILVPDPMRQDLDLALESGLSYELRGVRALEARDFKTAATYFAQGVDRTPGTTALGRSLRHKLGTALYLSGDVPGAVKRFEEAVQFAPATGLDESVAKAHYSLGIIQASEGRGQQAIAHLTAAVKYSPTYVEALLALGDVLRLNGRADASLERYDEVLRINPRSAEARFGRVMALIDLKRYAEARDALNDAVRLHPDRTDLAQAASQLLAGRGA